MVPVLSICILTYNRESYLSELLNSIFSLEDKYLKQLEVVLINNGSTDTTKTNNSATNTTGTTN
jgi:glycosyltransferase involved in cell wall biosynthesis